MKKLISFLSLFFALILITNAAQSQITVSGSTGADGTYGSLTTATGAFNAINSSSQTGNNIVVSVTGDVLTEDGLNGLNAGTWTSLTISPSGGAARTLSGSFTGSLFVFNGADNVTINGLNTGGNSLSLINTAIGASTSLRFTADATNNTITNCTILGSGSSLGVVYFTTGTVTGNDGNSVTNCNIGPAGVNLPLNGIFSQGTSAAIDNSNNTISGNNIYDYFLATASSNGININSGNSAWTITNNRLYQTANRIYTSANTHYGIFISSGSGYTITGNVIGYSNSSGTGTTNMIGMTSGSLGGTFPSSYTSGGTANATRYVAINCAFTAAGAMSSIQNNTIAGFALYTSSGATTTNGIFCGIAVTSGNVNIGTVTGNTIGATSGNGSIYTANTTSGGTIVGIYTTSANTVNIQNNTIGALDAMGNTTSTSGGITGINTAGAGTFTITGNTIGNSTNPNLRMGNLTTGGNLSNTGTTFSTATGSCGFRGILNGISGLNTIGTSALPNVIRNASVNSSSTSAVFRGIDHSTSSGTTSMIGNSISNLTSTSANTGINTAALAGMGIYINGSSVNTNVSENTISGLSLTNAVTTAINIAGIGISSANTLNISKNVIYDLSNASTSTSVTAPGSISGIFIRAGAANANFNIFNNMITLGYLQPTNTCIVGIWGNHGQLNNPITNIYYNSVYITGTVTSGAQPSFGYLRGDLSATARTATVDIRNNFFNNDRTGGTGSHYAISNNYGAAASSTGWGLNASNFNILNSASASTVGYWSGDQTFSGWKTASASDQLSLTAIPVTFANVASGNLHLNMGVTPTQIESSGIVISGYTTDIDGQTRPGPAGSVNGGATSPDIGADEFDGVPLDLTPPTISYNLLINSSCYTSRTLSASMFDGTGINTSGGTKPRVYYRKTTNSNSLPGTNDNTTDGWKYTEATNASSPFSFTIDYSILFGGLSSGDVVEYFVVAQDLAPTPNVGINSGTFASTPASVALTAGSFPITGAVNNYTMLTGLSGLVTIGASGTYTTLTGAGGLFEAINTNGLSGNLIAEILDANLPESGLNALNEIAYGCLINATLTIKPASGVTTMVSGSNVNALIDLNNADYVIFDGSNNGSNSKDMTIRNTGTGAAFRLINGATNNTVKNCIIESSNSSITSGTVFFSTSTAITGNSYNELNNCDIRDRSDIIGVPANAVYSNGSLTLLNSNNKISGCNVFNWTNSGVLVAAAGAGDGWIINPSSFYQTSARTTELRFISIQGGSGHSIINNFIGGTAPNCGGSFLASGEAFTGIDLSAGSSSVTNIQGNTMQNIRGANTATNQCALVYLRNGLVNVGNVTGNTFGSSDTAKRIEFGENTSFGINNASNYNVNISNNVFDNIYLPHIIPAFAASIYVIYCEVTSTLQPATCTVENNSITNIFNSANSETSGFGFSSQTTAMSFNIKAVTTIRGNTISNVGSLNTNFSTGQGKFVTGIGVNALIAGSVIEKNTISGLFGSSQSGIDGVTGIITSLSTNATVSNNVISIDGGNTSNRNITGITEQSGAVANVMNYYYNSVNIFGTSNGSNNTYAFRRNFATTTLNLRNNVFVNTRVAATGKNYAIANDASIANAPIGWPSTASNYNTFYSLNPATTTLWATTDYNLSGFQNASSGGDSYTLFGDPGFTSNTNLLPDGSNPNCWTLKGNGIALSSINSDIIGTPRSTTIMDGGTDIGAYEFTATVPPPTYNNATPSTGAYKFIHKQDTMATINVTTHGNLADLNVQYYSGENPPGLESDPTVTDGYGNVYWEISPTDMSNTGFTYDVTLHYSPALIGTIVNENNIKVAKNTNNGIVYTPFTVQGTGPGEYQLDVAKHNITVYGLTGFSRFILTDADIPLPVELTAFTFNIDKRNVNLNWSTASELNNSGFEIERSSQNSEWTKIGRVDGSGTSNTLRNYEFTDRNLSAGQYNYRLKQIDFNGQFTYFNLSNEVNIGVPEKFNLSQNYPNPFNPSTKIDFDLPSDSKVSVIVYDMSGKEVTKLVNEFKTAGYYTVNFNGANLSSGTYFYRITADGNGGKFVVTKKMVLVK